jgi:hypothetical protein
MGDQMPQPGEEVAPALGDAQQGRHLPDDDRQPKAEHESGLHGRGDEAGHEPDVQDAEHHQHDADQDGQGRRQVAEAGRVAQGDGRHQRRRDGRRGRGGADDQLPRAAEQPVAQQPAEGANRPACGGSWAIWA